MNMEWTDDLATGVVEIDDQHKEIFQRVAKLAAACGEGKGKDEVLRLLLFLQEYVKEHFAAEERSQIRSGYPGFIAHQAEHAKFMADVNTLTTEFQADGATLSLVIMTNKTLVSWLMRHISKTDKEFAAFLREKAAR
jgi:hemerythrin